MLFYNNYYDRGCYFCVNGRIYRTILGRLYNPKMHVSVGISPEITVIKSDIMKSTKVQTLGVMAAVYIHALMHRSHAHAHFPQR